MRLNGIRQIATLAAAVTLAGLAALAQQVFVPVSVAELCGMSDVIVDGTVARIGPARSNATGKLETPVEIAVTTVLKGPAGLKTIELIEPGGKQPATSQGPGRDEVYFAQVIPGKGERYVLFLKRSLAGSYVALGGLHGHYRIADGRIVVHPAMPRILRTGFAGAPVEMMLNAVRLELAGQ